MWVSGLPAGGYTGICEGLKGVDGMSEREMAASLLERVPDYKMGYVLAYLQGITADEAADDAFAKGCTKAIGMIPIRRRMLPIL